MDFSIEFRELARFGPDYLMKLIAAVLCGGIIGYEREAQGKAAGLRTCIMVCIGSTIFTVIGVRTAEMFGGDATRIASQILPGIGFLGAGVIMREFGRGVIGLTTAAIIWVVAALGMMIGSNMLIMSLGISVLIILLTYSLRGMEHRMRKSRVHRYQLNVHPDATESLARVRSLIVIFGPGIVDLQTTDEKERDEPTVVRFGFIGSDDERYDFLKHIYEIEGVDIIEWQGVRKVDKRM